MGTRKAGTDNNKITPGKLVFAHHKHKKSCGYYALFEQATDAIMVIDFKGNFIEANSNGCAMFGYTKDELLESNVMALIDKKNLKDQPIKFDQLASGENVFNEIEMVHKNGTAICVESNAKKWMDNRILIIARNITERKN